MSSNEKILKLSHILVAMNIQCLYDIDGVVALRFVAYFL